MLKIQWSVLTLWITDIDVITSTKGRGIDLQCTRKCFDGHLWAMQMVICDAVENTEVLTATTEDWTYDVAVTLGELWGMSTAEWQSLAQPKR